jgi:hypothetical protein
MNWGEGQIFEWSCSAVYISSFLPVRTDHQGKYRVQCDKHAFGKKSIQRLLKITACIFRLSLFSVRVFWTSLYLIVLHCTLFCERTVTVWKTVKWDLRKIHETNMVWDMKFAPWLLWRYCLPECDDTHYNRRVPKIREHLPLLSSK